MKHLTPEQRVALREIFNQCDLREGLLAVAGIVKHDVQDLTIADEAGGLILKAAALITNQPTR